MGALKSVVGLIAQVGLFVERSCEKEIEPVDR